MRSAVFFERDGILNRARVETRYQVTPLTLDEFFPKTETAGPLRKLKAAGFLLLVTTNQPGLTRGYQSRRELDLMHVLLRRQLPIDDIFLCPHDETDRCPCRRPKPGLLIEAAFKWHLDLDRCFVVSDKWQDAQAAHVTGCTSLLVRSPWNGNGHHDSVLTDFSAVVDKILHLQTSAWCPSA